MDRREDFADSYCSYVECEKCQYLVRIYMNGKPLYNECYMEPKKLTQKQIAIMYSQMSEDQKVVWRDFVWPKLN